MSKHNRPQKQGNGNNGAADKSASRRTFLKKSLGALAGLGLLSVPAVPLVKNAFAADTSGTAGPDTIRRNWCMVVDLRRCDGCTGLDIQPQCTKSCVLGHYVPEGMKWIEVFTEELPGGGTFFLPLPCNHCENAPCVNVCPVGATYHTEEGVVLIDQRRCIGCRMCMAACPYHRRFFNWGIPDLPAAAAFSEYSPEHQSPGYKGTVMKCDFCPDMMKNGSLPPCVNGCPRKVLYMGDLSSDLASNGKEVKVLSDLLNEGNAYRLKEELGTQPRVFFLPGHGEAQGRNPADGKALLPTTWDWGGNGYDDRLSFGQWEFKK